MSGDGSLIERFIAQELDASVCSILKTAFDERAKSKEVLLRDFEFNLFEVSLNFEKGIVTLQDVLSDKLGSSVDIPIYEFASACGLKVVC
jgi:hypothetical protein